MAVSSVSSNSTTPQVVDKDQTGFNALNSDAFMKMLIVQLQNQDPTQPMGNEELLQQLSMMRNLQASVELDNTLKSMSASQQVSSGAAFLGKIVTGNDAQQRQVTGVADRVFLENGSLMIGIGDNKVAVSNVTGVNLPQ
jgi:flagellar basal-body rod modification protein FlgD